MEEGSMTKLTRPPPRILYISNDDTDGDEHHLKYLADAGLHVAEATSDNAVTTALSFQPDIIVLDFEFDGEIMAALQAVDETKGIPVVALVKLMKGEGN